MVLSCVDFIVFLVVNKWIGHRDGNEVFSGRLFYANRESFIPEYMFVRKLHFDHLSTELELQSISKLVLRPNQ